MTTQTIFILNKIVATISIFAGVYFSYESVELYYLYEFTSTLFLFMVPFNNLIVSFSLGLTSIFAGVLLYRNRPLCLVTFYSLSVGLLALISIQWLTGPLDFLQFKDTFRIGNALFILIYFNIPIVLEILDKKDRRKDLIIGFIAGLAITIVPTLLFQDYVYS